MTNTQLELIISEKSAKKMIDKLDENYLVKSCAVKLLCKRRLLDLKMEDSENPTDFYNDFERLVNELKNAGENLTKGDKLNYFLLTLSESMSHMVDIVDALAEKDKTVGFVKSKLEVKFKKKHGESENSKSNAFTFKKRKGDKRACYVCVSVGQIQYDCPKKNNSWNRGTPQRREGQSRAPQRGGGNGRGYSQQRGGASGRGAYQQRGSSSNWRGSGRYGQRGRGARTGDDGSQAERGAEKSDAFSASVGVRSANTENGKVNEKKIEWILDSGCTDDVSNNENYFSDSILLREPVKVKVDDGRLLKATKIGHVMSKFKAFDNETNIELKNVFYVNEMDKNLISFAKVTDNHKVVSIGDSSKIYNEDNKIIAIVWKSNRIYKMTSYLEKNVESNLVRGDNEKMSLKEK